jgi:alkanesulfonate monooxygenase SsuD/methylene tetrahydromethanopterin reductase-like flavin-dependent oxidoreductase (luciferase family)
LFGGGEVDYREGELNRSIRLFHQQLQLVNTRDRIPIYVAGNAPKAIELAGEIGDGFITSRTNTVEGWRETWARARASAERAGRDPRELYTMLLTAACLLEPGESHESPRVRAQAGPWAMVALHALYESVKTWTMRRRRFARRSRPTRNTPTAVSRTIRPTTRSYTTATGCICSRMRNAS